MRRLILTAVSAVCGLLAGAGVQPTIFNHVDPVAMESWVEAQLRGMTPEQRVAQLIVMAVNPQDDAPTRALVKHYVEETAWAESSTTSARCTSCR